MIDAVVTKLLRSWVNVGAGSCIKVAVLVTAFEAIELARSHFGFGGGREQLHLSRVSVQQAGGTEVKLGELGDIARATVLAGNSTGAMRTDSVIRAVALFDNVDL